MRFLSAGSLRAALATLSFFSAVLAAPFASAQELQWLNVRAVGGGNGTHCKLDPTTGQGNVQFVTNGGQLSIIYESFGINLSKRTQVKWDGICTLDADVIIPQGYFIRTLSQSFVAGILKEPDTTAGLTSNLFLFQKTAPLNSINMTFGLKERVSNVLLSKENTQIFTREQIAAMCAVTALRPMQTVFQLKMAFIAAKPPFFTSKMMVNIDGSDVVYGLEPSLEPCANAFL